MPDMQARQDGLAAYYFHQGTSERAYDYLGAHRQGAETVFRVWAPNADRVSLCGDFNGWDPAAHPMERVTAGGVWEIRVDSALIPEGMLYKYFLCNGEKQFYKADPYGFRMQCPPRPHRCLRTLRATPGGAPAGCAIAAAALPARWWCTSR